MNSKHLLLIAVISLTCTTSMHANIFKKLFTMYCTLALLQQPTHVHGGGGLTFYEECSNHCEDIRFHSYETTYGETNFEIASKLFNQEVYTECEYTDNFHVKKCCHYRVRESNKKKKMKELSNLIVDTKCADSKKETPLPEQCLKNANEEKIQECIKSNTDNKQRKDAFMKWFSGDSSAE